MSGSKASVIEKINRMPDEMNEFELIERLYMLSRLNIADSAVKQKERSRMRMSVSILGKRGRCMRTDEKKEVHSRETITRKRYLVSHE